MVKYSRPFYGRLAPLYHLIYPDWEESVRRQATDLDSIIRDTWGREAHTILDASCGIGTQALGLAGLGYEMTASDICAEEIDRARSEAATRGLTIAFSVADMRECFTHHRRRFDVVVSCDNAIPHLLTDEEILAAFRQFYQCTRSGGGCIVTVRDYEMEDLSNRQIKPCVIRDRDDVRWLLWQVWDPEGPTYDLTLYVVEDRGGPECRTQAFRSTYYAVRIPKLIDLMGQAGFAGVRRLDGRFFQPAIIGTRKT